MLRLNRLVGGNYVQWRRADGLLRNRSSTPPTLISHLKSSTKSPVEPDKIRKSSHNLNLDQSNKQVPLFGAKNSRTSSCGKRNLLTPNNTNNSVRHVSLNNQVPRVSSDESSIPGPPPLEEEPIPEEEALQEFGQLDAHLDNKWTEFGEKMSDSIGVSLALGLVKSVVCVYDVVTLPVYFLLQKPWETNRRNNEVKSVRERPEDPYSPWVRVGSPPDHACYKVATINELVSHTVNKYKGMNGRSFGYREQLGEEDEVQPDGKVFKKAILGEYKWLTYEELDRRIDSVARGLMQNGVKPRDTVLIFAETRLEWMLSAQAIFRLGGTIATLYATLGDDGIIHGVNETEVTHIITTFDLLPKLKNIESRIPLVTTIIYIEGHKPAIKDLNKKLIPFSVIEQEGKTESANKLRFYPPAGDDAAVVMYTSGSTGVPKGVVITHKNVLASIGGFNAVAHSLADKNTYMAYLPLAHVLEMAAECFFFSIGCSIGYSTPHTMTDKSTAIKKGQRGDAILLQPTVIAAVPLVLDRIRKGISEQMEAKGKFVKGFFDFVLDYKKFWSQKGFDTPIINRVVCKKIKDLMGGRITYMVSGSAPLSPETHEFVRASFNVTLIQGYGLTETAAGATLMDLGDKSVGRAGPPIHGTKIRLSDWKEGNYHVTDKPYPRGEIVIGGSCVTEGYFKNDQLTSEAYRDEEGTRWFYTGDIGEVHPDGSIKIIDRKKDLVKLQFGEYISLGKVEAELKSCPLVDNICIYGDSFHTYVIALVTPNPKVLTTLAKSLGKEHLSREELCQDPVVIAACGKQIIDHSRRAKLHKMETPTKVMLCPEEWTPDSGLVTAAMKIRRRNIQDHYKTDIKQLYGIRDGTSI